MSNTPGLLEAGPQYDAAHEMHYTEKNLQEAIALYQGVMAAHPDSGEAGFARSQIQNIVNGAVPVQVLMDAQAALALTYLDKPSEEPEIAAPASASPVLVADPDPGNGD